jgi:hypothetical protein
MLKSFKQFNESNSEWLVKCLTEEEREKWLDEHYSENLSQEEVKMFCDFVDHPDDNMRLFKKHERFPKPEINDLSVRYYFTTGSYMDFEKMEDDWYYIQTNIIRPTRYFVVDGKLGFEKFKSVFWDMREGTSDLNYTKAVTEAKMFGQSDLYEEISNNQYQSLLSKHIQMSHTDIDRIRMELEGYEFDIDVSFSGTERRHVLRAKYNNYTRMAITKIEDDYFLLNLTKEDRKFKCDTLEGLLEIIDIYLH